LVSHEIGKRNMRRKHLARLGQAPANCNHNGLRSPPAAEEGSSCQAQVGMSPFLPSRNVPLGPEGRYHADGRNGVGSAFVGLWVASAEPADQRAPTARRPVEPSMLG
jgi:hypothetical protein